MESYARSVPVVMYRHVSPSPGEFSITPEHFESQMHWLARNGYVTLTADEFACFLHGAAMPEKSILLTFDGGYLDNYVHAHPCLVRYGLNAIMFLVTSRVQDGPARSFFSRASGEEHSHAECERLVLIGQADDVTVRWSEIDIMRAAGTFEFHSHTHSHLRWGQLCTDPGDKIDRIRTDIETSKRTLTEKMGVASAHLCWPEGCYDGDCIDAARAAGFEYLYTTRNTQRNVPGSAPYQIHRMTDNGKNGEWLARKVQQYQHEQWGRLS
ncbi:polysaccharide deacetylase [Burkholderia pyrrocinia]|uniref:Polysaccharide deacetylase n=3 Tax=Burkholderia TaxID=32008 RepID=A0A318INY4_BURPY|nr:polysaccharide deacetylase family protein [Burkholderia sp. NFPP32]PXX37085.1 polysaccharide deacetylase [Burkholderia pyrrocinia]SFW49493.1 Polysaccharide deacetylase [Burkholderia sp. NFACC33-1]SFX99344.1 Polysaccharide deacetylase [Burkholderia sp. NFPP32]